MPTSRDDALIQLIVRVLGKDQAASLRAELDKVGDASDKAQAKVNKAAAGQRRLGEGSETARSKVAGLGQSFLQLGRGVQDFQAAGLNGIINNVEGLTTALGMGTGLAGVLTIAATAVMAFGPALKAAFGAEEFRQFADRVEELKGRVKDLEDKKIKFAVDFGELDDAKARLDALQKQAATVNALLNKQSAREDESGKAVGKAITDTPQAQEVLRRLRENAGERAVADLTEAERPVQKLAQLKAEGRRLAAMMNGGNPLDTLRGLARNPTWRAELKDAELRIEQAERMARDRGRGGIDKLVTDATEGKGDAQLKAQAQLQQLMLQTKTAAGFRVAQAIEEGNPLALETKEQARARTAAAARAEAEAARAQALADEDNRLVADEDKRKRAAAERARKQAMDRASKVENAEAADLARTAGPRFDQPLRRELLAARVRGEDPLLTQGRLATQIARQLGGTDKAGVGLGANRIVQQAMEKQAAELNGLVGDGMNEVQAIQTMFGRMQAELARLQAEVGQIRGTNRQLRQRQGAIDARGRTRRPGGP